MEGEVEAWLEEESEGKSCVLFVMQGLFCNHQNSREI